MTTKTDSASTQSAPKPKFALFVATAAGLGYFPKAPGTFGSLGGLVLAVAPTWLVFATGFAILASKGDPKDGSIGIHWTYNTFDPVLLIQISLTLIVAAVGVWSATRAARYWAQEDPQRVVIDEVSGQHITLLLGCALPALYHAHGVDNDGALGFMATNSPLNWKYLLVGFILFRLFDIWKPFPARQAEALPSGLGIMADDWVAGLYAGIGLWLARCAGL
jgi:phosphatidylglycerophosphatase A